MVNSFLDTLNIPRLTEEQKNMCEGKILPVECEVMLASFQSNKAPGNNSNSAKFHRKFWHLLCLIELDLFPSM